MRLRLTGKTAAILASLLVLVTLAGFQVNRKWTKLQPEVPLKADVRILRSPRILISANRSMKEGPGPKTQPASLKGRFAAKFSLAFRISHENFLGGGGGTA